MSRIKINLRYSFLLAFKIRSGYISSFEKSQFKKTKKISIIRLSRLQHYFRMNCNSLNINRLKGK